MTISRRRQPGLDTYREVPIDTPAKGLLTSAPGLFINPDFTPNAQNVRFYVGEVVNRPGTVALVDSTFPVDPEVGYRTGGTGIPITLFLHQRPDRSYYLLAATNRSIFYYNTTTLAWTDISGAVAPLSDFTGSDGEPFSMTTFGDKVYMSNGVDKIHEWDDPSGADVAEVTASVASRYLTSFAGRVVAAHTNESAVTYADRVRWSKREDPDVWDPTTERSAGWLDTVDWPGQITGMVVHGPVNYIFKRDYIIAMVETGLLTPSFGFSKATDIGCLEGRSIAQHGNRFFFLGPDDVYAWTPGQQPAPLGAAVRSDLLAVLNREYIRKTTSFINEAFNEYWLVVPTGSDIWPSTAYVYNYGEDTWAKHENFEATCSSLNKSSGEPIVIDRGANPIPPQDLDDVFADINSWITPIDSGLGGADLFLPTIGRSDKKVYTIDDALITDAGTAVDAYYESSDSNFGVASKYKTVNAVSLMLRDRGAATISLQLSTDGGRTWKGAGNKTIGTGSSATALTTWKTRCTGTHFRIRLDTTDAFALQQIIYHVLDRGDFK